MTDILLVTGVAIAVLFFSFLDVGYALYLTYKMKKCIAEIQSIQMRMKLTDFQVKQMTARLFPEKVRVKSDGSLDLSNLISRRKIKMLCELLQTLDRVR